MEDFEFECGECWAENWLQGRPKGFWSTTHYDLPGTFTCWNCDTVNITPSD